MEYWTVEAAPVLGAIVGMEDELGPVGTAVASMDPVTPSVGAE